MFCKRFQLCAIRRATNSYFDNNFTKRNKRTRYASNVQKICTAYVRQCETMIHARLDLDVKCQIFIQAKHYS